VLRPDKPGFTGIFTHALPRRPFLDRAHILMSSQQRTLMVPLVVNINSGEVHPLLLEGMDTKSVNVLDVANSNFLVVASNPDTPHTVIFGTFTDNSPFTAANTRCHILHSPPQNGM
jgi:hypothetical protein